jgi:hypothetical protein
MTGRRARAVSWCSMVVHEAVHGRLLGITDQSIGFFNLWQDAFLAHS